MAWLTLKEKVLFLRQVIDCHVCGNDILMETLRGYQ